MSLCETFLERALFWRKLSQTEYRVLLAVARSLSYSDVAKAAGVSSSYASLKVRKLGASAWLRFWADYKAMSLSPTYLLCKYSPSFLSILSRVQIPYLRSARKVWSSDGVKLLVEATPPLGLERRFAYLLPVTVEEVWVAEWEARYVPGESRLVAHAGSSVEVRWSDLPAALREAQPAPGAKARSVQAVDALDLLILREKEKDCFLSLSKVGERIKASQQLVSYHFRNHVKPLWVANCVEPKRLEFPIIYRVETDSVRLALSLLSVLSRVPSLVNALALQGSERTLVMLLDVRPEELPKMHAGLLSVEGVRKAELLAFVDPSEGVFHGLTAHLGLRGGAWSLEPLEEVLEEALGGG